MKKKLLRGALALAVLCALMLSDLTPFALVQEASAVTQEEIDQLQRELNGMGEEKAQLEEEKQKALYDACVVPMEIIKKCGRAIELAQEFATKGNKVIIADSGSSAVLCKAAMQAASFNIYINTNMMKDKDLAKKINGECTARIVYYGALADAVFGYTTNTLINTVIETGSNI